MRVTDVEGNVERRERGDIEGRLRGGCILG